MKVLYVAAVLAENTAALRELAGLDPTLDIQVASGAAAALAQLRAGAPADAIIIDEESGDGHVLQAVRWLKAHAPGIPLVVLTSPAGSDLGGAALDMGADDVVSKVGSYARRLAATLHTHYLRKASAGTTGTPSTEPEPRDMSFDRDREELLTLRQSLADERERRIVLEGTLRQAEDRARTQSKAADIKYSAAIRHLESQLTVAADRLHDVANQTQILQTRLQNELAEQAAERGRLIANNLFGYATLTIDGALVRCNRAFARMFGFDDVADAVAASTPVFDGLPDHAHVVDQLQTGSAVDRVESVMRRSNGRVFRVLTSATFLPAHGNSPALVERLLVDLDDRMQLEEQLRLARRLESAGRLAAEMSGEIESVLPALDDAPSSAAARAITLVRQLLSYSRKLAKPAGLLSLYDAIRRAEPHLRQIAGDGIAFEFRLDDVGPISGSEDDVEQLLSALVFAASASLPYGGTIAVETRSVRSGFDQRTELAVGAIGYGVQSASLSSSLARLVTRCGGTVRVADDPARATTLLVHLPC